MRGIRAVLMTSILAAMLVLVASTTVSAGDNFHAHLSGNDANVETKAQGQAILKFSSDDSELYYKINVANIEGVTMAHIHLYTSSAGGPPVVWLIPDGPPPNHPSGVLNGTLVEGTVDASRLVGPLDGMTLWSRDRPMSTFTLPNIQAARFEAISTRPIPNAKSREGTSDFWRPFACAQHGSPCITV